MPFGLDIASPEFWLSLFTLTTLEIVLGLDNVIFISIIANRLPAEDREKARKIGLLGALLTRIALLFSIAWVISLTSPLFTAFGQSFSWRDIILIAGGLFLLQKGTLEIHEAVEGDHDEADKPLIKRPLIYVIGQIMILDIVFSLDSVITAVGMVSNISVMIIAMVIAIGVMLWAAEPLAAFIEKHPTVKMLALSFLLLVGVVLVADGLHFHVPRGYLYFAIAFSIGVEILNQLAHKRRKQKEAQK